MKIIHTRPLVIARTTDAREIDYIINNSRNMAAAVAGGGGGVAEGEEEADNDHPSLANERLPG